MNALRLAGLTNPVEVFQDDPLIVRLGVRDDLFADAVIGAREEFNFGGVRRLRGFDGPDLAHYTKVQLIYCLRRCYGSASEVLLG